MTSGYRNPDDRQFIAELRMALGAYDAKLSTEEDVRRAVRPMDAGHGWGARAMELALAEHGIALEPPDDIEAIGRSLERILLRDDTPPYRMGAESHNPRDVSILGGDPSL